jgi:hypothetical protein
MKLTLSQSQWKAIGSKTGWLKTAGWWEIKDTGGHINWDKAKDSGQKLYNGDHPADLMDEVLEQISKVYKEAWGRPATPIELEAVFNFCMSSRR